MATETKTITTHSCDLCGQVKDQDQLRRLYGEPGRVVGGVLQEPGQRVDICESCADKSTHHVFAFIDGKPPPT